MRVRMRTNYAGPRGTCPAGRIIDLPPKEAKELITRKFAEAIKGEPEEAPAPAGK